MRFNKNTDCAELAQLRRGRRLPSSDVFPVGNVQRKEQAQWCLRGYRRDGPQCGRKGKAPIFADKTSLIPEKLPGDAISLRLTYILWFCIETAESNLAAVMSAWAEVNNSGQRVDCAWNTADIPCPARLCELVSRRVWNTYLRLCPFCLWNWAVCIKHTAGGDHVYSSRLGL